MIKTNKVISVFLAVIMVSMLFASATVTAFAAGKPLQVSGYARISNVKDEKGNVVANTELKKGYICDIELDVADPNINTAVNFTRYQFALTGNSFTSTDSGKQITIKGDPALNSDGNLSYTLVFPQVEYTGNGSTLSFTTSYDWKDDKDATQTQTNKLSIRVLECTENPVEIPPYDGGGSGGNDDDDEKIKGATPYIIVDQYNYGGGQVAAGSTFPLKIRFYNTHPHIDIENIVMTIAPSDALSLASSSNTFYISLLESEKAMEKAVNVQVKPDATPESHSVTVSFKYEYITNDQRMSGEMTETIAIPVYQADRMQATAADIPTSLYPNEEYSISLNLVNKGKSTIYNVAVELVGNMANPGNLQNLGNYEAGKSGSADFDIMSTGEDISGEMVVTYEDSNMNVKEIRVPFNIPCEKVEEPVINPGDGVIDPGMDPGMEPGMEDQGGLPLWAIIAIAVGVVVVIVVIVIIVKKVKANRSEFDDEDI